MSFIMYYTLGIVNLNNVLYDNTNTTHSSIHIVIHSYVSHSEMKTYVLCLCIKLSLLLIFLLHFSTQFLQWFIVRLIGVTTQDHASCPPSGCTLSAVIGRQKVKGSSTDPLVLQTGVRVIVTDIQCHSYYLIWKRFLHFLELFGKPVTRGAKERETRHD